MLGLDLRFEVLGDLPLGLVMVMMMAGGARLAGRLAASPEPGIRGPGPRQGASLGLALQPLVGGARGGREGRGPGPLGPGAQLRGGRQLGQGRQRTSGRAPHGRHPLVAARAARGTGLRDVAGTAAAAFPAGHGHATAKNRAPFRYIPIIYSRHPPDGRKSSYVAKVPPVSLLPFLETPLHPFGGGVFFFCGLEMGGG